MSRINDLGIKTLESFKCFILDNKMNNLGDNSIEIKLILFHLIYKERYYTHKTRAKLNNLISALLSNVKSQTDDNVLNTASLLPSNIDDNLMKYWNLNTLQQNKQQALNILKAIYAKFDEFMESNNEFESKENCILLPLVDIINNMSKIETNTMFQNISNDFYIFLHSANAFEDVSEKQLQTFLSTLTNLNAFFDERNSQGNKNQFTMNFHFILSEEENAENNAKDKLHWLSEIIRFSSTEHCKYTCNIDTLHNKLKYFEFKDFSTVDPRVVFQGDIIFNTNFLNTQSINYRINRIPVLGYPAVKRIKAQSKVSMCVVDGQLKKIKQEFALHHKKDMKDSVADIQYKPLLKEYLATVYKLGDCYFYLDEKELKALTTLNIPVEERYIQENKFEETDDEDDNAQNMLNKHTLFNKSIVPMYTMERNTLPHEYLIGESQIITCDFYSNKTPVNKANYLAFISFVDMLLENDLVCIGRVVKKDLAPYDISMCCLSPNKTVTDGKENRSLILTRIVFGAENKYARVEDKGSTIAEKLPTKKQKTSDQNVENGQYRSSFASLIEKNTMNIDMFESNNPQVFIKDKGDNREWIYTLKLNQGFPCVHIKSALNEKKTDAISLYELHDERKDKFTEHLVDQLSSKYNNDDICYNSFDLKRVYDGNLS
ncbi:uncharacterized protein HGUI_00060 [Hanseniaspora guilliermondii]|uniref:Uncharacterized protein n=1 Tax=Hanseniaspora guilliermondii TaxID=56406 RepID=A0A1L0AW08_9ASCO|nr:uncharacterized protein HGUI_00060 [Hanseniaspora guilliermondii]